MMRPGTPAPRLVVDTLDGDVWDLKQVQPEKFTLVVFYRGLHCPICKSYLQDLEDKMDDLRAEGVSDIIAISGDTREKAEESRSEWNLKNLTIGYGLSRKSMADWGLFISKSIKESEPTYFSEPGVFLVDKFGDLFYCATNSMPFARPRFKDLIKGLEVVNEKNYPRRGTVPYDEITEPKTKMSAAHI